MFEHFNAVSWTVTGILTILSAASWYVICTRSLDLFLFGRDFSRVREKWRTVRGFEDISAYTRNDRSPLVNLMVAGAFEWARINTLPLETSRREELLWDLMAHETQVMVGRLRRGLGLLTLTAATAPFIGLLGTVIGIYHALTSLAAGSGEPSISMISSAVGETLIMTAFGLITAIPAAFAGSLLSGRIRRCREELDSLSRVYHTLLTCRMKSDGL